MGRELASFGLKGGVPSATQAGVAHPENSGPGEVIIAFCVIGEAGSLPCG